MARTVRATTAPRERADRAGLAVNAPSPSSASSVAGARRCVGSRAIWWASWSALALLMIPAIGWSTLALRYCLPLPEGARFAIALALPCTALLAIWRVPRRRTALMMAAGALAAGLIAFYAQAASHERDWVPEVSALPWAEIDGERVTLHNIRSCDYRSESDFDLRHRSDTFDLSRMTGVDLFQVYWGSPAIAHTMLSFGFDDGRRICLSVETRRERGEMYDAIRGFFRQYEIIYIWGDETDLVRLRTDHRGETVYRYRLNVPLEKARAILLEYLRTTNDLRQTPQWYNALLDNCTTTLIGHARPIVNPDASIDWRWLANGYLHEVMHERGTLDSSVPLEQLRRDGLVNGRAPAELTGPEYSRRIRGQ
jgi:hypothetical protein